MVEAKPRTGGRTATGRMSMRYIGGGHKKKYRIIDFKRNKAGVAEVLSIEYDPNRTSFIALLNYADGEKRYIIAPQGLVVGNKVESGENVAPEIGHALPMKNMPLGTNVHNIEMQPGQGGKLARSAGSSAQLTNKEEKYAILKMPSGELRKILVEKFALKVRQKKFDGNWKTEVCAKKRCRKCSLICWCEMEVEPAVA